MNRQAAYRVRHKEEINAKRKEWKIRNPEKARAHSAIASALKRGTIKKPDRCEKCLQPSPRIAGHHSDYSKPLVVTWLCFSCHGKLHGTPRVPYRRPSFGEKNGQAKLTVSAVREIRSKANAGQSKRSIARDYGVSDKLVRLILKGELWKS